jgi:hypothetical protein
MIETDREKRCFAEINSQLPRLRAIGGKKAITLQDWTDLEGSKRLMPPDFNTIGT